MTNPVILAAQRRASRAAIEAQQRGLESSYAAQRIGKDAYEQRKALLDARLEKALRDK